MIKQFNLKQLSCLEPLIHSAKLHNYNQITIRIQFDETSAILFININLTNLSFGETSSTRGSDILLGGITRIYSVYLVELHCKNANF